MIGYAEFVYEGRNTITLDNHNDDYEMDFEKGDKFYTKVSKGKVTIIHEDEPKILFVAKLADKKYRALLADAYATDIMATPHPKYPAYPYIRKLSMDILPKLYAYYNEKYFNNICPKQLAFKRTNKSNIYGMASRKYFRGKFLYSMQVNMKLVANDPIVFIDMLLHEMIHLYLYRLGEIRKDDNIVNAGHGPLFKAEMVRINRDGFNISPTLSWEQRAKDESSIELYYVSISHDNRYFRYFWTDQNFERHIDAIYTDLVSRIGIDAKIQFCVTTDVKIRVFDKLTKSLKAPKAKFDRMYNKVDFKGRVLKEFDVRIGALTNIEFPKAMIPIAVQPMQMFTQKARIEYNLTMSEINMQWQRTPKASVFKYVFTLLDDAMDSVTFGMNDADIKRKLNYIYACVDGRIAHSEYATKVKDYLRKHKFESLLDYKELKI